MYATNTTVVLNYPGFPQTTTSAGWTATLSIIDGNISRADNLINAKLAQRYDVSSFATSVPPLVKSLSEDISTYYTLRAEFSGDNKNVNEWAEKFKDSIDILNEIRDGTIDLVDSSGNVVDERSTSVESMISSNTKDYAPTFGEDGDLNQSVDSTKLDDLEDARL